MPTTALSLVAVGDIIPSRRLSPADNSGFAEVVRLVSRADVAVANLDTALTFRGAPREKLITVRADPAIAPDLRRMGLDVISVANNHSFDYGDVGMADTLEALESAELLHVGAGPDLTAATAPAILIANSWRIGVLGWTCVLPTGAAAAPRRPGQAPLPVHVSYEVNPYLVMEEPTTAPTVRTRVDDAGLAAARDAIRALRSQVDLVVVLVHWGGGLSDELAEYQRPLGHALVDAGADVVVGSHPHRVLGIERYRGKAIFYSPGTLIEQLSREGLAPDIAPVFELLSPDSFVARLDFSTDGDASIRITPTTLCDDGVPQLATGDAFERIAERIVRMSAQLDTHVGLADGELRVADEAAVPA
jgi:poly-gamma-glutamate capsule biosynthesis protein CapA/YwtB (metallophosphatase superfamily)